jgi:hypothetical protein
VDNPEYVYLCYSRKGLAAMETARFERLYLDRGKAEKWSNKKNCQTKRYYFWIAERVSD